MGLDEYKCILWKKYTLFEIRTVLENPQRITTVSVGGYHIYKCGFLKLSSYPHTAPLHHCPCRVLRVPKAEDIPF